MAAAKASMLLQLPSPQTIPLPRQRLRRRLPVTVAMALSSSSDSAKPIVLGCGGISTDYLATVASFPNPDDKIRSLALKMQGGGNVGNALTAAARLGLASRIISKVANDAMGRSILKELQEDGVDTSYMVVSEDGNSSFTYIIVDNQTKTRTCIHTPNYPPMVPEELTKENLFAALDSADIVYFDARLPETALVVAEEAWTGASSVPVALVSMLLRLPNIKFVIVTLGEKGCIMLERSMTDASEAEERDVEILVESLEKKVDQSSTGPKCIASKLVNRRRFTLPKNVLKSVKSLSLMEQY
ncbi:hypothetical protein PR202_ga31141 [Eleusine coracana subsp. coracana]|uniref:Carbohydrate kinase PfkB domain-containing protein n=1 Tax=Eleusine coracana subsp. coracana TaxID=191504 RepID=A0AAV5DQQ6_ELECO|nr:hypothetical protein PR202_ga31141 [Eleusine coracana subsp. coracana]